MGREIRRIRFREDRCKRYGSYDLVVVTREGYDCRKGDGEAKFNECTRFSNAAHEEMDVPAKIRVYRFRFFQDSDEIMVRVLRPFARARVDNERLIKFYR